MLKFRKKNLFYFLAAVILVSAISGLIPALRIPLLNTLKYPLNLLTLSGHELGGIVFYHRNLLRNERFKKEIDLLRNKLNTLNEIYLENNRLRALLSFKQKTPYKVIAARVIARSPDNWSSIIIVDKGQFNGIKRGSVVINYLGLAGRVIETTKSTSKIMLINDPNFGVSAIVQRSRQEGLVTGTLGNSLIMKYLTKDSDVKVSDSVITSGLTNTYPKGLVIGVVTAVGEEFSGLSHYAIIRPAVDLSNLEEVLIIVS